MGLKSKRLFYSYHSRRKFVIEQLSLLASDCATEVLGDAMHDEAEGKCVCRDFIPQDPVDLVGLW